jgi:N6-L-threonylcarbamoyladenine synthase
VKILGIETSCDETAAAVVEDGHKLLSSVVASSMYEHVKYGGVVPEVAARAQIESIIPVIDRSLAQAFPSSVILSDSGGSGYSRSTNEDSSAKPQNDKLWDQIDGIAVTYGAGLGGSLLVGVLTARSLAITHKKPLYAINHVEGHIYANFITERAEGSGLRAQGYKLPARQPEFPMLGLIVSGGHTQLVLWKDHFDYKLLGQTQDDAIGEAFDKVAKILGLPYPGGPSVSKLALKGDPHKYQLPVAKMPGKYDFSFSGPKTAVLRLAQQLADKSYDFPSFELAGLLNKRQKADIAASFQYSAVKTVVDKTVEAFEEYAPKSVAIGGGVASSPELRRQLAERLPLPVEYTDPKLCTDNGAMIAALGCYMMKFKQHLANPYSLDIAPNLTM